MVESTTRITRDELARLSKAVDRLDVHSVDCDKRLSQTEMTTKLHDGELASLRSTRHEHSNWLNRHNLEIDRLGNSIESLESDCDGFKEGLEEGKKMWNELNTKAQIATASGKAVFWLVTALASALGSALPTIIKLIKP